VIGVGLLFSIIFFTPHFQDHARSPHNEQGLGSFLTKLYRSYIYGDYHMCDKMILSFLHRGEMLDEAERLEYCVSLLVGRNWVAGIDTLFSCALTIFSLS
jgi:hypothetical protein